MASVRFRQTATLEERLFKEGHLFEFPQAVALLERLDDHARDVGSGPDPSKEGLRFCANPRLSFASAAIERIVPRVSAATRPTITVNFMGLIGANGALPHPFAELVLSRARRGDTAALAFLDIFHHRLLSLVYRSFRQHYIGLGAKSPEQTPAARYLYSLVGLGTPQLLSPLQRVDAPFDLSRTLLHYAGLLARKVRSMSGLTSLLELHFGVPVEGRPMIGAFYPIEEAEQTRLGRRGRNNRLGQTAIVGARYWDQEACFELRIGPLDATSFLRFLPGGDALSPLCKLTRFYAGTTLDFRIRLLFDPNCPTTPSRKASRRAPAQSQPLVPARPLLGRTTWVGASWQKREVVLSGALLSAELRD